MTQRCQGWAPINSRVPELVAALIRARGKGTLERLIGRLGRVSLLVLDDWGMQGFSAEGRRDLLEIVEALRESRSWFVRDDPRYGRILPLRSGMEDHPRDVAERSLVAGWSEGRRTTGACRTALLSGMRVPVQLDMPRSSQSRPIPRGRVYSAAVAGRKATPVSRESPALK